MGWSLREIMAVAGAFTLRDIHHHHDHRLYFTWGRKRWCSAAGLSGEGRNLDAASSRPWPCRVLYIHTYYPRVLMYEVQGRQSPP